MFMNYSMHLFIHEFFYVWQNDSLSGAVRVKERVVVFMGLAI
jgi:hypothetical protein